MEYFNAAQMRSTSCVCSKYQWEIAVRLIYSFYFQGNWEKSAADFIIQFYIVKNLFPILDPESLMTDFEKGSIIGFLKIYLNTRITSIDEIWPLYTGAGFNLGDRAFGDVFRKKALLLCQAKGATAG